MVAIWLFFQHQHFTLEKFLKNKTLVITVLIVIFSIFAIASQTNIASRLSLSFQDSRPTIKKTIQPCQMTSEAEEEKYRDIKKIEKPLIGFGGESKKI